MIPTRATRAPEVDTGFPPARSLTKAYRCGSKLRRAKAGRKRSCSKHNLERDADAKKRHVALRFSRRLADRLIRIGAIIPFSLDEKFKRDGTNNGKTS